MKKGPWSNISPFVQNYRGVNWTQLPRGGWVGYTLSGAKVDIPHILEVEFPPDVEQDVSISIVEPKANTSLDQLHGDAGITIGDHDLVSPDTVSDQRTRHRIVFWPKSTAPVVVIANRGKKGQAAFGKIRLEAFPQGLPVSRQSQGSRKRIAILRGEFLRSIFHADPLEDSHASIDSWASFLTSANRLVAYLKFAGYDGASLNVVSDGSSLYPSSLLNPTARFDRGIFAGTRKDPFRKDILEMLFRLFDRDGLIFIPAVEFATPLPELESILAKGGSNAEGIDLVNPKQSASGSGTEDGLAPYYNPLNDHVQRAMANVLKEISLRYDHHASFRGLRLNCRWQGYTHLPGISWAFDSRTVNEFVSDTAQANPGWQAQDAIQRLALQVEKEEPTQLVQAWVRWRADRLTAFYRALAEEMQSQDRQLFISVIDLMQSAPWQQQLRPALPRRASAQQVLLELGMDIAALQTTDNLTVLRPNRIARLHHLGSQAVNLEANELDIQQDFQSPGPTAVQFHYETSIVEYPDFDRHGPTRKVAHRFLSTFQRAGFESRRHVALGLAQHDDIWVFEGGAMFPFGQEQSSRTFFQVYRDLPDHPFQRVELEQSDPIQAWVAAEENATVAYFVNTSPWEAKARIQWRSSSEVSVEALGRENSTVQVKELLDHYQHDVTLEPYGIYALRFGSAQVELLDCQTELPSGIAQYLHVQLDEIVSREKQIESRSPSLLLANPSFDEITRTGQLNAWFPVTDGGGVVEPDSRWSADGEVSLRLYSPSGEATAQVKSQDFAAPESGRLVVFLKLRKVDPRANPPLVLRLESTTEGYDPDHLFENIPFQEFGDQGLKYVDLPTDPDLRLRIGLELKGAGEVWVDDIRFYDRWIFKEEKKDLKKILHRASVQIRDGDFSSCYQTLSGYWPRFLLRHVPPPRVAIRPEPVPMPVQEEPRNSRFFDLRRFIRLRK